MNQQLQRRFDRAAKTYDANAAFQDAVGGELRSQIKQYVQERQQEWTGLKLLDLGCGTGTQAERLTAEFPGAQIYCVDIAPGMVREASRKIGSHSFRGWCGLGQRLALTDNSIDLVFSNLTLQWIDDLCLCAREIARVLHHEGALFFTALGPKTLWELSESVRMIRPYAIPPKVFPSMPEICLAFQQGGLEVKSISVEERTLSYRNLFELLSCIKGIGGNYPVVAGQHGLITQRFFRTLEDHYVERLGRNDGLPATYEIIWGIAVKYDKKEGDIMVDQELLEILACPECKGVLEYNAEQVVLICANCRLKYPIRDGIPIMLKENAERF